MKTHNVEGRLSTPPSLIGKGVTPVWPDTPVAGSEHALTHTHPAQRGEPHWPDKTEGVRKDQSRCHLRLSRCPESRDSGRKETYGNYARREAKCGKMTRWQHHRQRVVCGVCNVFSTQAKVTFRLNVVVHKKFLMLEYCMWIMWKCNESNDVFHVKIQIIPEKYTWNLY